MRSAAACEQRRCNREKHARRLGYECAKTLRGDGRMTKIRRDVIEVQRVGPPVVVKVALIPAWSRLVEVARQSCEIRRRYRAIQIRIAHERISEKHGIGRRNRLST